MPIDFALREVFVTIITWPQMTSQACGVRKLWKSHLSGAIGILIGNYERGGSQWSHCPGGRGVFVCYSNSAWRICCGEGGQSPVESNGGGNVFTKTSLLFMWSWNPKCFCVLPNHRRSRSQKYQNQRSQLSLVENSSFDVWQRLISN